VHIESSMVTVTQFARAVLPHGTTAAFIDPHEIANVLGLKGVKLMLEEAKGVPLKVYVSIPSCVPASFPEFETAGAEIGPADVEEAMKWDGVVALGEVMNYPGVIYGDEKMHGEIQVSLRSGKVVEGHWAGPLGSELSAYVASGVSSSHESTTKEMGLAKVRLGMYTMIREGSAWKDLADVIKIVTEEGVDTRRVCLVTDDRHPEDLISEGHMDHVVRRAIEEGVDPVTAIQMATINTAEHFNQDQDIGAIAPGRFGDVLIVDDLKNLKIDVVVADGKVVAKEGKLTVELKPPTYPSFARETVKVKRRPTPSDLEIKAPVDEGMVKVHVIGVLEGKVNTKHLIEELEVKDGKILPNPAEDIAKVVVIERHKLTGNIGKGFVKGFGFKKGAVASTVAHDSHNLLVVGMNDEDMTLAANELIDMGGGMIAVSEGKILGLVELPIAGLMSDQPIEEVAEKVERLERAWRELGCEMVSPFMTMSLLALSVLPELRITDRGLIDTVEFKRIDLIAD
ncbi:MAG: adenine deaminase, partial [Thermoproteota archaeon]